jgi:hypothetical protein
MQALIGKITKRTIKEPTSPSASTTFEIGFKPVAVLPHRTKPPEWLNDQTLTVERTVPDPREIGACGESIVLTAQESRKWLEPLRVSPAITYGAPPARLKLILDWWKDEKAPEFTVTAAGRTATGTFEKQEPAGFAASVDVACLLDGPVRPPLTIEIVCDKLTVACACLSDAEVGFGWIPPAEQGRRYRIDNRWYGFDVAPEIEAGLALSLREKGRGCDHFAVTADIIRTPQDQGQLDVLRLGWGWSDKLREAPATCVGGRREGRATRFGVESLLDEGQGLRSSVVYTSYDDFPVITVQREFQFHKPKDKKDESGKPKEVIDDVQTVGVTFRTATAVHRDRPVQSRVLTSDGGDRLVTYGSRICGDGLGASDWLADNEWRAACGWVMVEHPDRKQNLLYCFDRENAPKVAVRFWNIIVNLVVEWLPRALRPEEAIGFNTAIAAGELCGARGSEAWVALRVPSAEGGVEVAVIGRLHDGKHQTAEIALAGENRSVPMDRVLLPGIGHISHATARFASGRMDSPFDIAVDGIRTREGNR